MRLGLLRLGWDVRQFGQTMWKAVGVVWKATRMKRDFGVIGRL
jgi:hypothetical protein